MFSDRPPGMQWSGPAPDLGKRKAVETDSDYYGRMARLEESPVKRLTALLIVLGISFLGTDLVMSFVVEPVEGSSNLPLLPVWAPMLGLATAVIALRVVRRLREPRRRSKPFDWPEHRRF